MTDLASLAVSGSGKDEGAWMTITHPATGLPLETADGSPVRIRLVSLQSDACKRLTAQFHNQREKKRLGNRKYFPSAEEIQENSLEMLITATVEFEGVTFNERKLDYSPENARTLYNQLPWLREQAERFLEDWANFLPKA